MNSTTNSSKAIILLGAPAAGKGTISTFLEKMGFIIIRSGAMLREEVAKGTQLGHSVAAIMNAGELVPDEIVIELVRNKVKETGLRNISFDGFPRTAAEAKALDNMLLECGFKSDDIYVLTLNVSEEQLMLRSQKRRADDIAVGKKPRDDDSPEIFSRRLKAYEQYSVEVCGYFGDRVNAIDGNINPQHTFDQIQQLMGTNCVRPDPDALIGMNDKASAGPAL